MGFCLNCCEHHDTPCHYFVPASDEVTEEIERFFERLPAPKARPISEADNKMLDLIERNMKG